MATRTLNLTEEQAEVIRQMVANGSYDDASQVVDDALRLLKARWQDDQADLDWLRGEIQLGFDAFDRGEIVDLDSEADIENLSAEIRRRGRERLAGDKHAAATAAQHSGTE